MDNKNLKILFLKEKRTKSGIEGVGKNIIYRCIELNKRGIDYLVLYNGKDDLYQLMLDFQVNVQYLPFPSKSPRNILHKRYEILKFRKIIHNIIISNAINHIHVHNAYLLDFLNKSWGIPVTAHHHSAFIENKLIRYFYFKSVLNPKNLLKDIYNKLIVFNYSKADKIIAVSENARSTVIDKYGVNARKVNVVYNGINDMDVLHYKNSKHELGFTETDIVILSVGRVTKAKGVEEFCELAKLHVSDDSLKFVFVGGFNCKKYYKEIVSKYSEYVLFTGLRKDVLSFYRISHVFLFLSHREACPNVVIESMYFKLPIIGWHVPGVSELVKDNHNGFICPFGDLGAVHKKLKILLADKKEYQRISQNAYLERSKYTVKENTDKILGIFKELQR